MSGELTLFAALLLGLAGSGHCLVMCGGIATAFGVSGGGRAPGVPLAASLGRIGGYATLGALFGSVGLGFGDWLQQPAGLWTLRALAALALVLMGLQLGGNVATASVAHARKGVLGGRSQVWKPYEKHLQPLIEGLRGCGAIG